MKHLVTVAMLSGVGGVPGETAPERGCPLPGGRHRARPQPHLPLPGPHLPPHLPQVNPHMLLTNPMYSPTLLLERRSTPPWRCCLATTCTRWAASCTAWTPTSARGWGPGTPSWPSPQPSSWSRVTNNLQPSHPPRYPQHSACP